MEPIRVVIVDDHTLLREGTRRLLEEFPDLQVVGEADDGLAAVELARSLQPHVVILDIRMPKLNGIEAATQILREAPATKILILTAYDDDDYVAALLDAGAVGYLLKTTPGRELADAIRAVRQGETVLHPAIARKVAALWRRKAVPSETESRDLLTQRETEVLRLAARGWRSKKIAQRIGVSVRTVESHLNSIFAKLGVSTRTGAVTRALSRRLLPENGEGQDDG